MRTTKRTALVACVAAATFAALTTAGGQAQAASSGPSSPSKDKPASVGTRTPIPDSAAPDHRGAKASAGSGSARSTAASRRAVATVQARIASYVAKHGTSYSFGTYADPASGAVVVETDAPAGLVASLTDLSDDKATAAVGVKVSKQRTTDRFSRADDIPPFYGGGGLLAGSFYCSAGYAVQSSTGTRWMITAAHCAAPGTEVKTASGKHVVGVVTTRSLAPYDVEFIGGKTYAGRLFTGGPASSTSIPVVGAGSATVGYANYCHSGYTTGEQCGHTATSIAAQLCTSSGCKFPVIAFSGGTMPAAGDSGAPFYAKTATQAWVRGHVIAGNAVTGYVEPYTEIIKHWAVTAALG